MLIAFDRRRKFLHTELNRIPGVNCLLSQGAFYLFPNISSFCLDDLTFCGKLLYEQKWQPCTALLSGPKASCASVTQLHMRF